MYQTRNYLLIALAALSLFSCKKDKKNKTEDPAPVIYSNYTSLKAGNYWIYQQFEIDAAGTEKATNVYDSLYMAADTMINGKLYHTYMWTYDNGFAYTPQYLRDSLHYVVNHKGEIVFSSVDYTTDFKSYYYIQPLIAPDTIALVKHHMADKDFLKLTPAGIFKTSAFRKDYYMFPPLDKFGKVRSFVYRYAQNVGLVSEILPWYIYTPELVERRLVRYHVQ